MQRVILATLPGVATLCYFFGWGVLINVIWASLAAVACEALVVAIRRRPLSYYLSDYSALVTGLLLGIAIPPLLPWWMTLIGVGFAIILAKHLYGGLGSNPFNPAMVGYVVLLISFPLQMSSWLPAGGTQGIGTIGLVDAATTIFPFFGKVTAIDSVTAAFHDPESCRRCQVMPCGYYSSCAPDYRTMRVNGHEKSPLWFEW